MFTKMGECRPQMPVRLPAGQHNFVQLLRCVLGRRQSIPVVYFLNDSLICPIPVWTFTKGHNLQNWLVYIHFILIINYLPHDHSKTPNIGSSCVFMVHYCFWCGPPDGNFASLLGGVFLFQWSNALPQPTAQSKIGNFAGESVIDEYISSGKILEKKWDYFFALKFNFIPDERKPFPSNISFLMRFHWVIWPIGKLSICRLDCFEGIDPMSRRAYIRLKSLLALSWSQLQSA